MNQIYLVYKTDANHSYASRDLIGSRYHFSKEDAIFLSISKHKRKVKKLTTNKNYNLLQPEANARVCRYRRIRF